MYLSVDKRGERYVEKSFHMNHKKFETKKSLGQHFLNNPKIPAYMAEAATIVPTDTVLEIGPGTGALTRTLLSTGAHVVALEADARAISVLTELFQQEIRDGRLTLIHGDVRSGTLEALVPSMTKRDYKVVANIPYYLSGMLFRLFLESAHQPHTLVFLVQKEVAFRIARDKKESLLSLSVKVYGEPHYIRTVARGNFTPPPKVDSAIIAIRNISKKRLATCPESHFFEILHAGFQSKRKQLLGNLATRYPRAVLEEVFRTCGLPASIRGEDVSPPQWIELAHILLLHEKDTL